MKKRKFPTIKGNKMYTMRYPCNTCLVRAACNNFECPMIEEFLTYIYNNLTLITANEINEFRKSTPLEIRKIMIKLIRNKSEQWRRSNSIIKICVQNKDYRIWRTPDDTIEIISI